MENPLTRTAAYGEADLRAAVMLIDAGGARGQQRRERRIRLAYGAR